MVAVSPCAGMSGPCASFIRPEREFGCSWWTVCLRVRQCSCCAPWDWRERLIMTARGSHRTDREGGGLSFLINGIPNWPSLFPHIDKSITFLQCSLSQPIHTHSQTHTQPASHLWIFLLRIYPSNTNTRLRGASWDGKYIKNIRKGKIR